VTNTYDAAGDYTVTLTVNGPGGSSIVTLADYIVTSPAPAIGAGRSGGLFTLSGANCPPGAQYRILTSTNVALPLADWTPVLTNTFTSSGTFSFTNPATTTGAGFFRLISP
jgi:PKD repeat protein